MLLSACSRPLRGGRGLKHIDGCHIVSPSQSPPARGAWIETQVSSTNIAGLSSRPLRGGRGLKPCAIMWTTMSKTVAPCAGGVD
ncbi:MAG: hypothetical protein GW861_07630 [Deltaproteobacteria bacterium]|nr:hypothetical protein [Deltaproteobacteria bacterium]